MPEHRHLRRLDSVWIEPAIYFLTLCARDRRPILANPETVAILRDEFTGAPGRHGWRVGRYVVMPDHLHFFCASDETPGAASLSRFVGAFKEWSAKRMVTLGARPPIWQKQFFDHILRSGESYLGKWFYVRENPVRAGLVAKAEDWPHAGEIETLER
jgi:REP element-mobilizing transposase RayT